MRISMSARALMGAIFTLISGVHLPSAQACNPTNYSAGDIAAAVAEREFRAQKQLVHLGRRR